MRVLLCSVLLIFCNLYIFPNLLHYPKPLADFSDGGLFYTRCLQDIHRFLSLHVWLFPYIPNHHIQLKKLLINVVAELLDNKSF